jgi:hypothetical protein
MLLVYAVALLVALATAPAASALSRDHGASFAVRCDFSHRNSDDPIVWPGSPGAAHSHDFFGNRSTQFDSTYDTMTVANTTCTRFDADKASYWMPTVKWNGKDLEANRAVFYYRAGVKDYTKVQAFPADLRMVPKTHVSWRCGRTDEDGGATTPPTRCSNGLLGLRIAFPDCSNANGQIDSADHRSHMAYHTSRNGVSRCPSTHPIPVPALTMNVTFPIPTTSGRVTLSSGSASTMHADFWNTWNQQQLEGLVQRCINAVPPSEPRPEECQSPRLMSTEPTVQPRLASNE